MTMPLLYLLSPLVAIFLYLCYRVVVAPRFNVLRNLPGPPVLKWFDNHLQHVLNPTVTPKVHELFVERYGRTVRIRGLGPWDERLLTLDPVSFSHIVKNTAIYEKPWESRTLITSLIGCGMLSAEGQVHKRQRRVALPAFSAQNMRSLVEISFNKGIQLRDAWIDLLHSETESTSARIDVCQFLSRATFDVIGLAALIAYRDMFEIVISQSTMFRTLLSIYLPTINRLFPDRTVRTVQRCKEVIHRVAGRLIQEKKQKLSEGEKSGDPYDGKDLLTLLLKSNAAADLQPEQRISDDDILNNINTFMFAGSDTSSLSMTGPYRLRAELLSVAREFPRDLSELTEDQVHALHTALSGLPFLHNVTRESCIPTMYPVHNRDGTTRHSFIIPKGTVVHLSVEAFNLDKAACPGLRFALIEMKTLYYILLTNFVFKETEDEIVKHNVVLTRPYLKGRFKDGTQCPLLVSRYPSA
ncbi:cytochrome P450 [Mycena haematopus]|nr:cytochrome P450 [Mycena haematopus]